MATAWTRGPRLRRRRIPTISASEEKQADPGLLAQLEVAGRPLGGLGVRELLGRGLRRRGVECQLAHLDAVAALRVEPDGVADERLHGRRVHPGLGGVQDHGHGEALHAAGAACALVTTVPTALSTVLSDFA